MSLPAASVRLAFQSPRAFVSALIAARETYPIQSAPLWAECLQLLAQAREQGTLFGADGKPSEEVLKQLGSAGLWGCLVSPEYGGGGGNYQHYYSGLTQLAAQEPAIAGLSAVHSCIGATNAIQAFGTPEQQARWLPRLASGELLAAFALTEPNAGSDLTAIRTRAERDGNEFVLTGEKFFITNAAPGRVVNVVCLCDEQPIMLVVELPREESAAFHMQDYGLHVLRHTWNRGIVFRGLRVPVENLLTTSRGNGITLAYHGLNRGRAALCANAAGTMRTLLKHTVAWTHERRTFGAPLADRALVRRRLARMGALILTADALALWCGQLLDAGERGELECITAKTFAAQALREVATDLALKTHGGRTFLAGHPLGDRLHDLLAP